MISNYIIYRLLEGYLPPLSWVWAFREKQMQRARKLAADYVRIRAQWNNASIDQRNMAQKLRTQLIQNYPVDHDSLETQVGQFELSEDLILPTRFGNAIAAFEGYSWEIYRADAVTIWPRLRAVLPSSVKEDINNEKTSLDFLVNIFVVSVCVAACGIGQLVFQCWVDRANLTRSLVNLDLAAIARPLSLTAAGLIVSAFVYEWALDQVAAWGEQVKAAFDCYLPTLQKQLGYGALKSEEERRSFWMDFSALTRDQIAMESGKWPLSAGNDKVEGGASGEEKKRDSNGKGGRRETRSGS